jgi:glutamine amidotransferase
MCRFTLYLGETIPLSSLLTAPDHSLIRQSYDSRERTTPLNGDGFGVAWYVEDDPESAIFRSITPAWNNVNLIDLARVTKSRCVLAHVRDATQGLGVSESNCHPFRNRELTFAHNGDIGGFARLRRHLLTQLSAESFDNIKGTTDSEHFFALYCNNLQTLGDNHTLENMAQALQLSIAQVVEMMGSFAPEETCHLNIAITDGRKSVVCRYTSGDPETASSLYINKGRQYLCVDGVCMMRNSGDRSQRSVVVSSEPLSREDSWSVIAPNTLVSIDENLGVEVQTIATP